jgi:glycerol-3-phosphate dehydrogenase
LTRDPAGKGLLPKYERAFEYSDCWVQDSRLVVLNARDAAQRGARIMTRTKVTKAQRAADHWEITLQNGDGAQTIRARVLVNAAGPWVAKVLGDIAGHSASGGIRLVRGSHIVTKALFDHDRCYFFQGPDGRIIFAIPYEQDFTLIGTTDSDHTDPDCRPEISVGERDYLLAFANRYLRQPISADDIVYTYSGLRPLYDDGASSASAATRDYVLQRDTGADGNGAPLLNVFGGKITTYRRLAENALGILRADFPKISGNWTAGVALPGGDFPVNGVADLINDLQARHPQLSPATALRLVRAYGREAAQVLGDPATGSGQDFGAGLCEAEVRWLTAREFARCADDVVWRRSRLGLRMTPDQIVALDAVMAGWAGSDNALGGRDGSHSGN